MPDLRQAAPGQIAHAPQRRHRARQLLAPPCRSRGLSLIETMIVVTLISLGCTLAMPSLASLFDRQRLRGTAAEVASDLQWARSQALARNQALRYSIHTHAGGSCTIVHSGQREHCSCSDDGQASCVGDAQLYKASHWPRRERVTVEANVGSLLFDPLLGTATPAGSIRIVHVNGPAITHVVNVLGRVRSCSPTGGVNGLAPC